MKADELQDIARDLNHYLKWRRSSDEFVSDEQTLTTANEFWERWNLSAEEERRAVLEMAAEIRRSECIDCGTTDPGYYMVRDKVWSKAGLNEHDCCCLRCLQARLKRSLCIRDFTPCVANRLAFAGAGQLDRCLRREKRQFRAYWRAYLQKRIGRRPTAMEVTGFILGRDIIAAATDSGS
jgi:hypothetical protein